MARKMTPVEFAYLREQLAKKSRRTGGVKGVAKRTGRSISCLQYVSKAKSFEEYVAIRPVPKFKKVKPGQQVIAPELTPIKKSTPSSSQSAKSTVKAGKETPTSIVDGDVLVQTLKDNMAEAARLTGVEAEQRQKLIQALYVLRNEASNLHQYFVRKDKINVRRFWTLLISAIAAPIVYPWIAQAINQLFK